MNEMKKYVRDLNIVKNNLRKFYYNSASEWLKPYILNCITELNFEIARYTKKEREEEEKFKNSLYTIYDFMENKI